MSVVGFGRTPPGTIIPQWEYLVGSSPRSLLQNYLNEAGAQGWELVSAHHESYISCLVVLKRLK